MSASSPRWPLGPARTDPEQDEHVFYQRIEGRQPHAENREDDDAAGPDGPFRSDPWLITIAIILVIGVLYIASSLLIPLVTALLAYLTLRPVVARMCRWRMPQSAASGLVIFLFFAVVSVVAMLLYSPLQTWVSRAPDSMGRFKENFADVTEPLETIDEVEETAQEAGSRVGAENRLTVEVAKPDLIEPRYLINTTGNVLAVIAAIAVLTFFMLSSGDDLLNRVLNVMPNAEQRDEVLHTVGDIQDNVGRYLAQISLINAGLGVAVTLVMWAIGMPTPILWGVLATLFNFIPYVGPIAATALVLLAAGSTFDSTWRSLLTAGAFWLTTAVEGQFVTPSILGKTLKVGPVVVLVAVAFWGFLWGLAGVLLAVPLLIVMRQIFAAFDCTFPIAVVLGEHACDESVEDCQPIQDDKPIAELAH
jgi:predicted PurR-regulated permease PerM